MENSGSEERIERAQREARASAENAQGGPTVGVAGDPVPLRPFAAIVIFVLIFVVVDLITWTLLGGIGLAIGAALGAIAGALAAKLYVDRRAAGDT